jgi:hypothetical protein
MPSPFPGMNPYLEGYLWPDVHHSLASQFRRQLAPLLAPKYAVRVEVITITDRVPGPELGIHTPDVQVIKPRISESPAAYTTPGTISPPRLSVPLVYPIERRVASVHIRDSGNNELITSIEILSPANKREPGLSKYRAKTDELRLSGIHILEIDLIRRGQRPLQAEQLPDTPYLIALTRAQTPYAELWPVDLRDPLPTVPVPLKPPDPDMPLDLQSALNAIYDEAQYALTLDYEELPPPPSLSQEDLDWIKTLWPS